jgi:hypothetical protein
MSSGVRPKLKSRSSLMSLSQRRIRCFAGSSMARTSLRTRLDLAFRHLAGRFATLFCGPSMVEIHSLFGTGSKSGVSPSRDRLPRPAPTRRDWVVLELASGRITPTSLQQ